MAAKDEDGLPLYFFDHDWIVNYSGTLGHLHSHNGEAVPDDWVYFAS